MKDGSNIYEVSNRDPPCGLAQEAGVEKDFSVELHRGLRRDNLRTFLTNPAGRRDSETMPPFVWDLVLAVSLKLEVLVLLCTFSHFAFLTNSAYIRRRHDEQPAIGSNHDARAG